MDTILIGIAGGTGSGKTTLADKLVESFGRDEVSILRHDNCAMTTITNAMTIFLLRSVPN